MTRFRRILATGHDLRLLIGKWYQIGARAMTRKKSRSTLTSLGLRVVGLFLLLVLLVGCASWRDRFMLTLTPSPTAVVTHPPSTPTPSPTPTVTSPTGRLTLRVWVPDVLYPADESVLMSQIDSFSAARRGEIQVDVSLKKAQGSGSAYDLLTAAAPVAPAVLPDVVILPQYDLLGAAAQNLIQPATQLMPEGLEYFPVAVQALSADGEIWGFPYLGSLEHMVYREGVTTTAPLSWTAVISGQYQLLFPASSAEELASDTLLAMYLGAGGKVTERGKAATLDRATLVALYRFFAELVAAGQLAPQQALSLPNAQACWELYQQGMASLSPVPAGSFWPTMPPASHPVWPPTPSGEPIAVLHVWGMAIVTADPQRQQTALEFVRWLIADEHMARMAHALEMVPLRQSALTSWGVDDEGQVFLRDLFSHSVLAPPPSIDVDVRRALQAGLVSLLQQESASPEAAASYALINLRR